ncbi:unnamed protein product [Chrysoparadoxa australica]
MDLVFIQTRTHPRPPTASTPAVAAAAAAPAAALQGSLGMGDMKSSEPQYMLKFFSENPMALKECHHRHPALAAAVETKDLTQVRAVMMLDQMGMHKNKWEKEQAYARLEADPDNPENQKAIADMIKKKQIHENYEMAMEEMPEAFGRVEMLYIDTMINNHHIKAFVDSGAQTTIMSALCVEKCGLQHLVDERFSGEARGVGTCKILGKIHMAQICIGGAFFSCSFTILEKNDVDMLLGLDMLKRHQCSIDLRDNILRMGSGGVVTAFLAEKDLPANAMGRGGPPQDGVGDQKAASSASASASAPGVDPTKVNQLVGMGFPSPAAENALLQAGGDLDQATAILLAQSGA